MSIKKMPPSDGHLFLYQLVASPSPRKSIESKLGTGEQTVKTGDENVKKVMVRFVRVMGFA
jgi:hypothetical protein